MALLNKKQIGELLMEPMLATLMVKGVEQIVEFVFRSKVRSTTPRLVYDYSPCGNVTGVVEIDTPKVAGALIVSFPRMVVLKLLHGVYQNGIDDIEKTVRDGTGEVANVLYGILKKNLNERGFALTMAFPTVYLDENEKAPPRANQHCLVLPFVLADGDKFEVCISIRRL